MLRETSLTIVKGITALIYIRSRYLLNRQKIYLTERSFERVLNKLTKKTMIPLRGSSFDDIFFTWIASMQSKAVSSCKWKPRGSYFYITDQRKRRPRESEHRRVIIFREEMILNGTSGYSIVLLCFRILDEKPYTITLFPFFFELHPARVSIVSRTFTDPNDVTSAIGQQRFFAKKEGKFWM